MSRSSSSAVREWLYEPLVAEATRLAGALEKESADIVRAIARARALSKEILVEVSRIEAAAEETARYDGDDHSITYLEDCEESLSHAEEWNTMITRRVTHLGCLRAEAEVNIRCVLRQYTGAIAVHDELSAAISAARTLIARGFHREEQEDLEALGNFREELKENAEAIAEARELSDTIAMSFEVGRRELRKAQRRLEIERARLRRAWAAATTCFDLKKSTFETRDSEWAQRVQLAARDMAATTTRIEAVVLRISTEVKKSSWNDPMINERTELEALLDELAHRYSADIIAELDTVLVVRYRGAKARAQRVLALIRSKWKRLFAEISG